MTKDIHSSIKATIQAAKSRAEEITNRQQDSGASAKPGGALQGEKTAIIPYAIIESISKLDNIFEARLFGWILAKAQSVLKLYNKDLRLINVEHAMNLTRVTLPGRYLLQDGDKNYSNISKAFSLSTKQIIYTRDGHIYHLNIIAFPEIIKDGHNLLVTFVIHNELWHALLDFSKGYRLFNLATYITLTSKYAIVLYLLITQQTSPQTYLIGTLRRILGCDHLKAYNRGSNFFARVIDPAREELKAKAPWYFEYTANKSGRDHKYTDIVISPRLNADYHTEAAEGLTAKINSMRLRLDDRVSAYCVENFGIDLKSLDKIEQAIINIGSVEKQIDKLADIKTRCLGGRIKNKAGYLIKSLQNLSK